MDALNAGQTGGETERRLLVDVPACPAVSGCRWIDVVPVAAGLPLHPVCGTLTITTRATTERNRVPGRQLAELSTIRFIREELAA